MGSASAIVGVVRAEGYAAKNGNVAELLPEKAVFWARDALKSTAVRRALPWVFLCAFAPRLGKGFGAFTWEGLAPEEYALQPSSSPTPTRAVSRSYCGMWRRQMASPALAGFFRRPQPSRGRETISFNSVNTKEQKIKKRAKNKKVGVQCCYD